MSTRNLSHLAIRHTVREHEINTLIGCSKLSSHDEGADGRATQRDEAHLTWHQGCVNGGSGGGGSGDGGGQRWDQRGVAPI